MFSSISRSIKQRTSPKDVFYTPTAVAVAHIAQIPSKEGDLWLDPFRGRGVYYDHFTTDHKEWCEITDGRDFFEYEGTPDVICSNPPYSLLDRVLQKTIELKPRVISYLLLHGAISTCRLEMLNKAGYGLTRIHMTKVYHWYGIAEIYTFEKDAPNIAQITYDRIVHREKPI